MSQRRGRQNPAPTTGIDNGARVRLESSLPASVPVGRAMAAWCYGTYRFPDKSVEDLRIVVDGIVTGRRRGACRGSIPEKMPNAASGHRPDRGP